MTEENEKKQKPNGKATGNLKRALETISRRLLDQIKEGETPCKDLGELAKVMKQAMEIRQELAGPADETEGVRVVFEKDAEEFAG